MPIKFDQLAPQLAKKLAPVYCVAGEEILFLTEAVDAIRARARSLGFSERVMLYGDAAGFDWRSLGQSTENLSLFAEQKIIEVMLGKKFDEAANQAIKQYLAQYDGNTVLILRAGNLDKRQRESALMKTVESAGIFVYCWAIEAAQIPTVLAQRARDLGLSLDNAAAAQLAQRYQGNLLGAQQILHRLSFLYPQSHIKLDHLSEVVSDQSHLDGFDLCEKWLNGQKREALHALARLKAEDAEPVALLGILLYQIRSLAGIQMALARQVDKNQIIREFQLWGKREATMFGAARRLKARHVEQLIQQAAYLDRLSKGQARGEDIWNALWHWVNKAAG